MGHRVKGASKIQVGDVHRFTFLHQTGPLLECAEQLGSAGTPRAEAVLGICYLSRLLQVLKKRITHTRFQHLRSHRRKTHGAVV